MSKKPKLNILNRFDRRPKREDARISPFLREVHHLLLDQVPLKAWSRVLSVESGDGWAAEEAWRRLGRGYVCGVDLSETMTDLANRLRAVAGGLEFRTWDGKGLPFPDGSFDCVISTFALYRFAEPVAVLRELRRVLRDDGDFFMLEPDRKSFLGLYALWDYYFRVMDPGHVRYYTAAELIELLSGAGFPAVQVLRRYEKVLSGGKLLATAVVLHARPDPARAHRL